MIDQNVEDIKKRIERFNIPHKDFFVECMLVAESGEYMYYKGGIFLCDQYCVEHYVDIKDFWVRSFYSFIENIRLGSLFSDSIPHLQWEKIEPLEFSDQLISLLENFSFEKFFEDEQSHVERVISLKDRNFTETFKVLDGLLVSTVARSAEGYVSYFKIDKILSFNKKWHK